MGPNCCSAMSLVLSHADGPRPCSVFRKNALKSLDVTQTA